MDSIDTYPGPIKAHDIHEIVFKVQSKPKKAQSKPLFNVYQKIWPQI
ncbi:hypothetical protein CCACVL1_24997 [Corchorus capsularis]|uniref:Uncharacterized protein n=1 Tax=Corchorus capsularis TaxID=210143 RepID=A0A1R3GM80_COCAP|nr:hypothetical protein CCACVL1_24997 [Corchorus capsularis]